MSYRKGDTMQLGGDAGDRSPTHMNVNPMTSWLHSYGFWALYILMIALTRLVLWMTIANAAVGWTVTCVVHGVATFLLLHTLKGAPIGDIANRGKYDHLTFWEQIDGEYHGTYVRKIFSSVPVLLLGITFNWVRNDWHLLPWVIGSTVLCIVPKLPFMHRWRLFGETPLPPDSPSSPTAGGRKFY